MLVSELMASDVVSVSPDDPVRHAAGLMESFSVGAVPVTDKIGRVLGIVTDRDVVTRCLAASADAGTTSVGQIMSRRPVTVGARDDVRRAVSLMADHRVRRLPVVDESDRMVGMISLGDVSALRTFEMEASSALSEISSNIRRL